MDFLDEHKSNSKNATWRLEALCGLSNTAAEYSISNRFRKRRLQLDQLLLLYLMQLPASCLYEVAAWLRVQR